MEKNPDEFIQELVCNERYIFCPYVRAFFKFDKGQRDDNNNKESCTSFASENAFVKKSEVNEGLLSNMQNSFYFPRVSDEESIEAHLN